MSYDDWKTTEPMPYPTAEEQYIRSLEDERDQLERDLETANARCEVHIAARTHLSRIIEETFLDLIKNDPVSANRRLADHLSEVAAEKIASDPRIMGL